MRILTVVNKLTRGGTERTAVNYAIGFHQQGAESAVLAYEGGGCRESVLAVAGVPAFINLGDKGNLPSVLDQARAWQPDIVHIHRPGGRDDTTAFILTFLLEGEKRPKIVETSIFSMPDYSNTSEMIDVHLHLTQWCLWKWSRLARHLKPRPLGVVVPYGVEIERFANKPIGYDRETTRAGFGIPGDVFLVGRVGQPIPSKWSPLLLDTFVGASKRARGLHLLLTGAPQNIIERINRLPGDIRSRITILPVTDRDDLLREIYSCLDLFLHISNKGESFGHVLCEAMLSGVPVVTLSTPLKDNSQLEVVEHEVGGLVARDLEGLTNAVLRLYEDRVLLEKLARQAPDLIASRFANEKVVKTILEIYKIIFSSFNRQDIFDKINSDSRWITSVKNEDVICILNQSRALPSKKELALMWILHEPRIRRFLEKIPIALWSVPSINPALTISNQSIRCIMTHESLIGLH